MRLLGFLKSKRGGKRVKASVYHPYIQEDWDNTKPIDNAINLIGKSIATRKSDQQFNIGGVIGSIAIIVSVLWIWIYLISGGNRDKVSQAELLETKIYLSMPTITTTLFFTPTFTYTPTLTLTNTPTETPTRTQVKDYKEVTFFYSYYDPSLGGVNCFTWDEEAGECISLMASGLDWRNYYDFAVACPSYYPLNTVIYVEYPLEVRGNWTCLDICPVCSEGGLIDFLQHKQVLPWRTEIKARVFFP